jgi:hypothetical protein
LILSFKRILSSFFPKHRGEERIRGWKRKQPRIYADETELDRRRRGRGFPKPSRRIP